MPTSQNATATDNDQISESVARADAIHKGVGNTALISDAKKVGTSHGNADADQISETHKVGTKHGVADTVLISETRTVKTSIHLADSILISGVTVVHVTRKLTGVASFGIDMAGNDQVIPGELVSFFLDDTSGLIAANDSVPAHFGTYHGGVILGEPEVYAPDGKKLLSGSSVFFDGSTSYLDISSSIPDIISNSQTTMYSYFRVASGPSSSTLLEVADTALTTGSSISFTTFLSTLAYPNRPLATDSGDPFDHTEQAGYMNSSTTVDGGTGQLVLKATHATMTDYLSTTHAYTSGMVQTGGNIPTAMGTAFQYVFGHLEIDFKLAFVGGPTGMAGLKPVFRLTPRNGDQFPYPPEIDIMQMFGVTSMVSQVHFSDIVGDNAPIYENSYARPLNPTGAFHTASMDWDDSHVEWFLDGTSLGSYVGPDIARVPLFLSLNLGVGGAGVTSPNPTDFASGGAELRIARILVTQ